MSEGWIKLHRKLFDHWLWDNKPKSKFEAWLWIIQKSNHSDNKFMLGNQLIDVKRGQIITSEKKMMALFKWSKSKLRNFLKTLQNESMIEIFSDPKKTTLTVCNYGVYQELETSKRPVKDHKPTAKRPLKDTNNNVKNDKKEENEEKNYSEDSKEFRLSLFLFNNIRKRKPDYKIPDLQKWSIQSDYILRIDRRDLEEVKKIIIWCQTDEFWQDNILSTAKLRKQYDQLVLKMNKILHIPKKETVSHPSHKLL